MPLDWTNFKAGSLGAAAGAAADAAGGVVEAGFGPGLEQAAANETAAAATARIRPDVLTWPTAASSIEVDAMCANDTSGAVICAPTASETFPGADSPVRPEPAVTVMTLLTPVRDDPSPTNVVADTEPLTV